MNPKRIIIHHSATKDSISVSWSAIRRYHMFTRGWSDIGYHAGAEIVGTDVECFYGRPADREGAHTQGQNHSSLGFCFVGNYDLIEPDPMMLAVAAQRVLAPWCRLYKIPVSEIHGHREYANKSCPGELFDIGLLRDLVQTEME